MSDASFPEAARRLGVPLRVLREAVRAGRLPAPPDRGATAAVPAAWLDEALAAVEASPDALRRAGPRKVPAFARYAGTSAWTRHRNRRHEYARHRAAAARAEPGRSGA